jgi:hypothetical protein
MLSCSRPAQSSAYLAQVGAGVDQVSVTSTLYFHYYQEVVLSEMIPSSGPELGGFRITVHGAGFMDKD